MQRSDELKSIVLSLYQAASRGDVSFFEQNLSRDGVTMIGTDPNEWWSGHAEVVRVYRAQSEELGGGINLTPGDDLEAYIEGSVGWTADRPSFQLPDGSRFPARVTFVFHQEDGQWKVVQAHFSVGVPNEEAFAQELTT